MARRGAQGQVIELSEVRARRHLLRSEAKIQRMLDSNRRSLDRLAVTGILYTPTGVRTGRDLLRVHGYLLRILSLITSVRTGARPEEADVYDEVEGLLERTRSLTAKTGSYLHRLQRE